MHVGIPVAPVSPAYSLMSKDFASLRPSSSWSSRGSCSPQTRRSSRPRWPRSVRARCRCAELLETNPGSTQEREFAKVRPETVAKILFTSGSTGIPKGVINTHRMLCANQQMLAQAWPFVEDRPPVVVDWLPWNHTFGGNHNFNLVLRNGGTLYVDGGKPAPGPGRNHGAQPEGDRADDVLQRAARLRPAAALPGEGRGAAPQFLPRARRSLLRRRVTAAEPVGPVAQASPPRKQGKRLPCSRPGARPRPRRSRPRCTSLWSGRASSAYRWPAASSSSCPPPASSRCACADRT